MTLLSDPVDCFDFLSAFDAQLTVRNAIGEKLFKNYHISVFIKILLFSLIHHIRISDNISTVEIVYSDHMEWFEKRFKIFNL